MVCPECGRRIIYAPDNSGFSSSGDMVCSGCGLVLGRWQISEHGQLEEIFDE